MGINVQTQATLLASCSVHPLSISHDSAGGGGEQIALLDWFRKRTRFTPSGDDGVDSPSPHFPSIVAAATSDCSKWNRFAEG
jgi:hypothetical protein